MAARTPRPPAADLAAPEVRRYLEQTARTWLGLPRSAEAGVPPLPERLARLLLRLEEYERPERDRWGCWDHEQSENFRDGRLREAEIDRWVSDRRAELSATTRLEPLWPGGRRLAVCLTHDVDVLSTQTTPRQALRHARAGARTDRERDVIRLARPPVRLARAARSLSRSPSTAATLEHSLELARRHDAVASYFFTVPPATGATRFDCVYAPWDECTFRGTRRRVADVLRIIDGEGFDVGLHGSYRSGTVPGALAAERELLRAATGLEIATTRQHFLRWHVATTPQLQERAGLKADSSLGFNRDVGYRAGTSLPFRQFDMNARRTLDLLEVPLVVQDAALLGPIGLRTGVDEASAIVGDLLSAAAAAGGAVTFVFHPDKLVRPDWLQLYERTLEQASAQGAWLTSLRELDAWWRSREARLLEG